MEATLQSVRPDPRVTANLYCAAEVDEAIRCLVAPLYRSLDDLQNPDGIRLWILRDRRRGAHLKLRVHGPADREADIRATISTASEAFLSALPPAEELSEQARNAAPGLPPLDLEDEPASLHPDRTLVWTTYRVSQVVFGGPPFQQDGGFRDGFTRGLAAAGRRIAESFEAAGQSPPFGRRQVLLWELAILGLRTLDLDPRRRSAYLRYHRDWLLRFLLTDGADRKERMAQMRQHFDQKACGMEGVLSSLRGAIEDPAPSVSANGNASSGEAENAWVGSIRALHRRVEPLCESWDPQLDPWAELPLFAPFFKLFHLATNPLALNLAEEAFSYHLLLRAAAPAASPKEP